MSPRNRDRPGERSSVYDGQCRSVKRILSKFRKPDFSVLWEFHTDFCRLLPNFNFNRPRLKMLSDLYNVVINHSLRTASFEELMARFHVLYASLHSEKISWKVYKFVNAHYKVNNNVDFESAMKSQLSSNNIKCYITNYLRNESVWVCLYFKAQNASRPMTVYLNFHPFLPCVLIGGNVKVNIRTTVFNILSNVFQSELEHLPLEGYHIDGILKMTYQKDRHLIADNEHLPAMLRSSHRRRPALDDHIPEIKNADLTQIQERRQYVEKIFGKYEPPRTEKLSLLTCTNFCGHPNNGNKARCAIIFEGSHIMLGLSTFIEQGIMKRKLPSILEGLPTSGTNTVFVNDL